MPTTLCEQVPELWNYGFYRRLNSGKLEFISFCKPEAQHMIAMTDKDFNLVLDQLLPGRK